MGFSEKHLHAIFSTDLRDDALHHQADVLKASARADEVARNIGSLMSRVKYADTLGRQVEDNAGNLARLIRAWYDIVAEKGTARRWVRPGDIAIAPILFRRVADASLAHWLDGKCGTCRGSGVNKDRRICAPCKGSGDATIAGLSGYETKLALDMVSELMGLESSHAGAANRLLRKDE